ncbi:MAG: cytochrome c class I [Rhodanobacter denitrificans]|uniref:Cytochrome c class I n=1 Tax=Rhodanobacter denitrificans TaxID=666685 RepID=A0A2W5KF48_9GAMM|nr:MAG: cytochrome c class I [Rhodanobacter denitrificans]
MNHRLLASLTLAASAAVLVHGGEARAAELSLCVDRASPTASLDTRLAEALAAAEGKTVRVERYDGTGGERGYRLRSYVELTAERCDFVLGFPLAGEDGLPDGVHATAAYARTGFVLVTAAGVEAATLDALAAGTRVAVTFNTTPNLWFDRHPALERVIVETDAEAVAALRGGEVGAVVLWRPALATLAGAASLRTVAIDEPGARWSLVALYGARAADQAAAFDAAIARLRADGALARILGAAAEPSARRQAGQRRTVTSRRRTDAAANPHRDAPLLTARAAAAKNDCAADAKSKKGKGAPALFTAEQAELGKKTYEEKCAFCHAPDLNGRAGPALRGKFFAAPSHGYKLRDIFKIVAENMPATAPGSLSHEEYVQIMAYILLNNGYPAGDAAMTFEEISRSKVPLRFYGE